MNRKVTWYLFHFDGKITKPESEKLLKIDKLAKATNQTVATIRHWMKEGLLQVAEITESGYQMFSEEMVERIERVREMRERKITLTKIMKKLYEYYRKIIIRVFK